MGQQQLLLLVLGIVIVGLAVVAGINAFDENQQKSSQDALTQEAFRLATDAKAYYNKPTQFAGAGGTASELNGISWADIGVSGEQLDSDNYQTPWGTIAMSGSSGTVTFTLSTTNGGQFGTVTFNPDPGTNSDEIEFARGGGSGSGGST